MCQRGVAGHRERQTKIACCQSERLPINYGDLRFTNAKMS